MVAIVASTRVEAGSKKHDPACETRENECLEQDFVWIGWVRARCASRIESETHIGTRDYKCEAARTNIGEPSYGRQPMYDVAATT
jgi:hypothetical protein